MKATGLQLHVESAGRVTKEGSKRLAIGDHIGGEVPIPDGVVGRAGHKLKALLALTERPFRFFPLRDILGGAHHPDNVAIRVQHHIGPAIKNPLFAIGPHNDNVHARGFFHRHHGIDPLSGCFSRVRMNERKIKVVTGFAFPRH